LCERCSAPLDSLQRYCVACGERRGDQAAPVDDRAALLLLPPPGAATAASRSLLSRRSIGAVTVVVLSSGLLIGAAVGPAMTPASLASAAKDVVVMTSTPAGTGAAALSASSAAGSDTATAALEPPSGNVDSSTSGDASAAAGDATASAASAGGGSGGTDTSSSGSGSDTGTGTTTPDTTPTPDPTAGSGSTDAAPVSGTVVHVSHEGHGYTVATREGQLIALHARKAPASGTKVKAKAEALANGTFHEVDQKKSGTADEASFHGTVTFVDPEARAYTVSARGVSLLVHAPPVPEPPASPAPLPALGVKTSIGVAIRPVAGGAPDARELAEVTRQDTEPAAGAIDVESIVRSIAPDGAQIAVAADDAGESPQTIVLRSSADLVKALAPGMVIATTARLEPDGTWTLVSATDDSDEKVADKTPR
jgi:hypothetical protein